MGIVFLRTDHTFFTLQKWNCSGILKPCILICNIYSIKLKWTTNNSCREISISAPIFNENAWEFQKPGFGYSQMDLRDEDGSQ